MKKTSIAIILAAAFLAAVPCNARNPYRKARGTTRIVQYNIGAFAKELENSTPMIAAMMKEVQADAVCLNELDSCNGRHNTDQCAAFAAEMGGWNGKFSRAMAYKGGAYGVGISTPARIISSRTIALPKGKGSEPRACCVVETDSYVLAATHLDYTHMPSMVEQAKRITEVLKSEYSRSGKVVILAGDMNSTPDSKVLDELRKDWKVISATDPSFPAGGARKCIDYILVLDNGARYKVKGSAVMTEFSTGDVKVASDHLPVCADIKILRQRR